MKRLIMIIAAICLTVLPANAQHFDSEGFELTSSRYVDSNLRICFPMFFGMTMPFGEDSATFPGTKFVESFYYGLELASIRFTSPASPFMFSIGLRFTFMDFSLEDTSISYRQDTSGEYMPYTISDDVAPYDGTKSKLHASYFGVPARFYFTAGRAKLYTGIGADYMIHGWTKYKFPKYREDADGLFNRFRASAELGATYGIFGVFANYTFTPVLTDRISNSGVISFGVTVGM